MSSGKICCVPGCSESGGMHNVLHGFPNPGYEKERTRFNTWLYSIGGDILALQNTQIYKNRRVCRSHFEDKYLCKCNRITATAIPTLRLPGFGYQRKLVHCNTSKIIHNDHDYCKVESSDAQEVLEATQDGAADEPSCDPDAKKDFEATQDDVGDEPSCDPDVPKLLEEPVDELFSWQQPSALLPNDAETLEEGPESNPILNGCGQRDASSKEAGRQEQYAMPPQSLRAEIRAPEDDARARYLCNSCGQHITGCRYVCVQCVDWDLCGVCEAAGRHPAHYVLRVPEGKQKDAVEAVLRTIRRAVTDWIVLINEEEMVVKEETEEEDPIAVDFEDGDPQMEAPGDPTEPRDKNPTAAELVPDVSAPLDDDLYMDANASIEETGSAEPNQNKPSKLRFYITDKRPNKTVTHTQKLQLQDTYKKSSDTKVVALPVVRVSRGNRSGASLVTSHDHDVTKLALTSSDVDVETSRAVVPVPARSVTRSAGRKRPEKVPGVTSPERKRVAIIRLQQLP